MIEKKNCLMAVRYKQNIIGQLFGAAVMLAGLTICLALPMQIGSEEVLAWWGFLYPKFCMMETETKYEETQEEDEENTFEYGENVLEDGCEDDVKEEAGFYTNNGVKISFWLAKVLDW